DPVRAPERGREVMDHHPDVAAREVRAMPPVGSHAQRREVPAFVEGKLPAEDVIPGLVVREKALRPIGRPLDRAAQAATRYQEQRVLGIHAATRAEATTGVRDDDAQSLGPDAKDVAEDRAHAVRGLAAEPYRP